MRNKAKSYLKQIQVLNYKVSNKLTELYQLKTLAVSISVASEGERVQTSTKNDKIDNAVIKIISKEDEIAKVVKKLMSKKEQIIKQIEGISDVKCYNVLFLRYVENDTFENIAEKMGNKDVRQIYNIHNKALDIFADKYSQFF